MAAKTANDVAILRARALDALSQMYLHSPNWVRAIRAYIKALEQRT